MQTNLIISPLVGSAIGYFTNWLAIKMLFRPHTEKRIGNIRIPFTPGLIPKERERIAQKVGEAVGTHLLNEEVILDAILSTKTEKGLGMLIQEFLRNVQQDEETIYEVLYKIFQEETEEILHKAAADLAIWIQSQLKSEEIRGKITEFVLSEGILVDLQGELKDFLIRVLQELSEKQESVRQVIPGAAIESMKKYITLHTEDIIEYVLQYIRRPSTEEKLKEYLSRLISAKLGSFVSAFINVDSIYEGLEDEAEKYLHEEETKEYISQELLNMIDKLVDRPISDFIKLSDEQGEEITQWALDKIFTEQNRTLFDNKLQEKMRAASESQTMTVFLVDVISLGMKKILYMPINGVVRALPPTAMKKVQSFITSTASRFLGNKAKDTMNIINISDIVEKRVNSFDVAFAEEIILSIARKELQAITWLGALLGFILGFIVPLLS